MVGAIAGNELFIHVTTVPLDHPTIRSLEQYVSEYQGHNVKLVCTFDGFPDPHVTWISPSGIITPSQPHFHVYTDNTSTYLTISEIKLGDTGIYTCSISNDSGLYDVIALVVTICNEHNTGRYSV